MLAALALLLGINPGDRVAWAVTAAAQLGDLIPNRFAGAGQVVVVSQGGTGRSPGPTASSSASSTSGGDGRLASAFNSRRNSARYAAVDNTMATTARHPNVAIMKPVPQSQGRATIKTGGAAKCVSVPPIDTFTKSSPSVAYLNVVPGWRSKNCRASSSAQIVMAAGSVMNEPRMGPMVKMVTHHAAGLAPPTFANRRRLDSAKPSTGRVEASAMITTTNRASV